MYRFINEKGEHCHELDGKPLIGTSTVVGVMAKPLTWWAAGLAVKELGWTNPKETRLIDRLILAERKRLHIAALTSEEYVALLDRAYRAHADSLTKSADKGTDMHEELERYVKGCISYNGGAPTTEESRLNGFPAQVLLFNKWAVESVSRFIASEVHCYSERLWTGGITDCIFEDKQGRTAIMDFKSSKEAYLSQFFQIAGYDIAITENGIFDSDGKPIDTVPDLKVEPISYYAVFPFGMESPAPQFNYDTASARKGFEACVVLHKLLNQ